MPQITAEILILSCNNRSDVNLYITGDPRFVIFYLAPQ